MVLRRSILNGLHAAHQGVVSMLANAKELFFWPGLGASIRQTRAQCKKCNEMAPSQAPEPLIVSPDPVLPFQQTVTDLCDIDGHTFLILADRYTGWIEVAKLSSSTFKYVRESLLKWFTTYGVPDEVASDGGPPFNSNDYDKFLRSWDIQKRQSSAHYP